MAERPSVIFDLDGTLIDSAPSIRKAVNLGLADLGRPALSYETVVSFIGNGLPALVRRAAHAAGIPDRERELVRRTTAHYEIVSAEPPVLYPGVAEALAALALAGCLLGICTNKPEGLARSVLRAGGLEATFPVVIGGDTFEERKPHPAPLRSAVAALGRPQAIFVGDSEIDGATAEAAALPFLLFTEGYRHRPAEEIPAAARFADHAALVGLVRNFFA